MTEIKLGPGTGYADPAATGEIDEAEFGEWRPIATAPKSSRALVWGGPRHCDDGYHDLQTAWIDGCGNVWADDRKEGSAPIRPTHWMPLPEPPK
jgi:hypothetical protein